MSLSPLPGAPAGIYVHIPFCDSLCPYCDFAVVVRPATAHHAYAEALLDELQRRADEVNGRDPRTVYLGGGTPTAVSDAVLGAIVAELSLTAPSACEWTIEVNPNHVSPERARSWRAMGFTRVSLGVQSFQERYLGALGRRHSAQQARKAVEVCQQTFGNVTLDLIVGGPDHTPDELDADLRVIEDLGVPHVSVYELTVEPNTVFGRKARQGILHAAPDDTTADMLEHVQVTLGALGLHKYEVSNYARPGFESQHNLNYWRGGEYLGVGLGAHSMQLGPHAVRRRANTRSLKQYLKSSDQGAEVEEVLAHDHLIERLFVGLRSSEGVSIQTLASQHLIAGEDVSRALSRAAGLGLVTFDGDLAKPTGSGMMMIDTLAEIVADI